MTDTQAEGWRHPERHIARRAEARPAAELTNLMTLDAIIRTYGMDADELEDLMLSVRGFYRGGSATERQARFLDDLARSLDDLAINARPVGQRRRASHRWRRGRTWDEGSGSHPSISGPTDCYAGDNQECEVTPCGPCRSLSVMTSEEGGYSMKRLFAFAVSLGLVAALAVPAVAAPAEKTEVSNHMVAACGDDPGSYSIVVGTGFVVANDNTWTKVITATVAENCIPDRAVVQNAINAYDGACNSAYGSTYDWQTVTTPKGRAKQVCQGVIE